MTNVCFGLLVVFFCQAEKPVTVSDFCKIAGPDVVRLYKLTDAELTAMSRQRKEAIAALRRNYQRQCK